MIRFRFVPLVSLAVAVAAPACDDSAGNRPSRTGQALQDTVATCSDDGLFEEVLAANVPLGESTAKASPGVRPQGIPPINNAGCASCCGAAGYQLSALSGATCYCANVFTNSGRTATVCSGDPVGICVFNAALPANPPPAPGTPGQHNQVLVTGTTW
jgi:hypothetical protein